MTCIDIGFIDYCSYNIRLRVPKKNLKEVNKMLSNFKEYKSKGCPPSLSFLYCGLDEYIRENVSVASRRRAKKYIRGFEPAFIDGEYIHFSIGCEDYGAETFEEWYELHNE